MYEVVSATSVDNDTMDLDCQEYVPDIPNELEDEFILEEGDEEKCAARKGLKATQAAIPNLVFMAIKCQFEIPPFPSKTK